ncbi:MAG TPA: RsmG family class I SAM-dependent methyltransferase [Thermoanaerobaculia bacterium]|nr:RsmG family class I SAM-dependent methyltransferase [Thermoanaerobaculia bacterium]
MAFDLPQISLSDFSAQISKFSPEPLPESAILALYSHFEELRRWNRRLPLIGPGTAAEIFARHYGESLAALALIPEVAGDAVDLGSGAGFPGFPVAAARSNLQMVLVEAREKKASFLLAAARRAALPLRCLDVRVSTPLPAGFPEAPVLITVRAMKLFPDLLADLGRRMDPNGQILMWAGAKTPTPPAGLVIARQIPLGGSERRRIVELVRAK